MPSEAISGSISAWDRETETPEILALLRAAESLIARREQRPAPAKSQAARPQPARRARRFEVRKFVVLVTILAMLVSVIVALQWFRWRDAKRVADLTATVQSPPPLASPVPGMVGAGFSPRGFAAYVKLQKFDWRPAFIVVNQDYLIRLVQLDLARRRLEA
ncbi:MAG TPA: hypothetical protein VGD79_11205 [Thermoanaerobaculia bacterium]